MGRVSDATLRRAEAIIAGFVKGSLLAKTQEGPPTMLLIEHKRADKAVIGFVNTGEVDSTLRLWHQVNGVIQPRYVLKGQMPEGCTHRLFVRPPPHIARYKTVASYRDGIRTLLGGGDLVMAHGIEFWRQTSVDRAIAQFNQFKRQLAG